jgi:signal transduction histidine kinase/DNA-binding response OmpR family regulator/streptogramin lyase
MTFRLNHFILGCLLLPLWCAAVQPYTPVIHDPILEPWRWRHEEALADLGVLCMDEAEDGTLWFGNAGSIASYDGMTVHTVPFDEELLALLPPAIETPWATALQVLQDQSILVLVNQSLVRYAEGEWSVVAPDLGEGTTFTSRIEQGPDGAVWVLAIDRLWRIRSDFSECSLVLQASSPAQLMTFCLGPGGDVWVVEWSGRETSRLIQIPVVNGEPQADWNEFDAPPNFEKEEAWLEADEAGRLLYADSSYFSALEVFDPESGSWETKSAGAPKNLDWVRYGLLQCDNGTVWTVGMQSLFRFTENGEEKVALNTPFKLPNLRYRLYEDRQNRLWLIGRVGYVYSVDLSDNEWVTYRGLHFQEEDAQGTQWFLAGDWGVVTHHPESGEWKKYNVEEGLDGQLIRLFRSSHGLMWVVGRYEERAAIWVLEGDRWVRRDHPEFAEWIGPNAVFEAADGTVWFGAAGKLMSETPQAGGALQYRVNEDHTVELLKHYSPPEFPYYVTSFAQTPDETLWLGSTIVHRYDGEATAQPVTGLQGENCNELVVDRDHKVWAAKEHYGVCRRDEDAWQVYNKKDGVAGLRLSNMLLLSDASLLAGSGTGISRFDGTSWTTFAYPEWFSMSSRESGMHESKDGVIWLNYTGNEDRAGQGFPGGFRTVRHRPETEPPDTTIVDYQEMVSSLGNVHVRWMGSDPWSSTPVESLQYSWRLDGGVWSPFSEKTDHTFLKLSCGRHGLEVRARDCAFNIDPTPAQVEFEVMSPVWKQGWFIGLISLLVGLIVFLIWVLIKTRERYLLKQQAEREAFLEKQQAEREKNLLERQAEREALLEKQQEEREKDLLERQAEREALLLKQQKERENHLTEMDRLKTGFFTNISHELRTPMTVISGRLETVLNVETDEKKKGALSIVLRNAQRVSTLVNQLLDFRKIEEGKVHVEATHGDLVPSMNHWISSLQVLAEKKQITLSLEAMEECKGQFDFDKLQKICTNLISNAIKYTHEGGEVGVLLQEAVDDEGARMLRFEVEDSGEGISQENLQHIFDRFYRVSEASMAEGAGIGLNLTKELTDLLGGVIWADSPIHPDAERPGARFCVYLPIDGGAVSMDVPTPTEVQPPAPEDAIEDPVADQAESSSRSGDELPLILTVEDDEDIRQFIVDGLEDAYRVETAENGEIGLQKAKELVPDLVITDVMMPIMDGTAMCRELKTSLETSHIPVVMLTAKASLDSQMEGLKTGADDYVTKPFHLDLLQVRIANLLESRRLLREKFLQDVPLITSQVPENTSEREFLEKALQVLEENYSDWDFNRESFASGLNMNLRTLQRKLKAIADRSPTEFISEFRITRGAELLLSRSDTVTEIAFQSGYTDSSHFARAFKKVHGMSPSQYRKEHRSE